jgi:hypothetical protein
VIKSETSDTARQAATHTSATATQTHAMFRSIHHLKTSLPQQALSTLD